MIPRRLLACQRGDLPAAIEEERWLRECGGFACHIADRNPLIRAAAAA